MVHADEVVSDEEELLLEEVQGLLHTYINDDVLGEYTHAGYRVVIAAQDQVQKLAIETLLPTMQQTVLAGGIGYLVGTYYSQKYADLVCDQYRALGFFTVNMPIEATAQQIS